MKFLIDECLSPNLARHACDIGHEGVHVNWRNLTGAKDWDLLTFIEEGSWTFVTRNSMDFRGDADEPGKKGQYARLECHAGLICLNGPPDFDRHRQLEYFKVSLAEIGREPDIVNQVIEVWHDDESLAGIRLPVTRCQGPEPERRKIINTPCFSNERMARVVNSYRHCWHAVIKPARGRGDPCNPRK